ncbi:Uncharacterised protein [uncultured archaeon]|nr:Uncharacterised protein [uncultured archaeon]
MNVVFRGKSMEILDEMVRQGFANTKSEAVRLAVINFGKERLSEAELVNRKLDQMDREVAEGKRKLLTAEEALGEYAKYLKKK